MFTINTEAGEITSVLHLKIPNVPTHGRDTVKRNVRGEQEKYKDTLLYGPMDEMRRKQMLWSRGWRVIGVKYPCVTCVTIRSGHGMMDRSPTSTQPAPYSLDHEHNGLWLKKIVLEALKEYALD
jgi:hypothetical protein